MNSDTYEQLSLEEIEERIYNIDSDRAALEAALDQKRQQDKVDVAQEVKDLIVARGYEVAEIVELLTTRRRGAGRVRSSRSYARYVDPENPDNVYVRGAQFMASRTSFCGIRTICRCLSTCAPLSSNICKARSEGK